MKNRVYAFLTALVLSIAALIGFVYASDLTGKNIDMPDNIMVVQGVFLQGKEDCLVLIDGNDPVIMNDISDSGGKIFEDFESGDKVEIYCTGIDETYPGRTDIYNIELVSNGSIDDVDKQVYDRLCEMGWVE